MAEKAEPKNSGYMAGIIAGLIVGIALFWMTMQLLIVQRPG